MNNCGKILANVTAINHNVSLYCADLYMNANSVTMWATYKGVKGNESHAEVFRNTPKPSITTVTSNKIIFYMKSGQKGSFFFILLI